MLLLENRRANRRYLYFAAKADVEGYNDVAAVFRSTAEGETGHAHGHLEYLEECGDPATGKPFGDTVANLETAIAWGKLMNTLICIQEWQNLLETKDLMKLQIGLRL